MKEEDELIEKRNVLHEIKAIVTASNHKELKRHIQTFRIHQLQTGGVECRSIR